MSRALVALAQARLTAPGRRALTALYDAEVSCGGPGSGYAWASSGPLQVHTGTSGGYRQVAVDYPTVRRLFALDLVTVASYAAHWDDVELTDRGRAIARQAAGAELVSP